MSNRILCTEDDLDTREMLLVLLENSGYDVVCANDAQQAYSLITTEQFDLLLVDNWMPGGSGLELVRAVRSAGQSTPILFYSGAAAAADKQEALDAGAQGYLTKPIGIADLVSEVERLIGGK
ncbi:MAG TPA: response regulator [Pyrinomonadaceae bacterium]|nr:response regulator [Pyrinomonadaceae bacterium]